MTEDMLSTPHYATWQDLPAQCSQVLMITEHGIVRDQTHIAAQTPVQHLEAPFNAHDPHWIATLKWHLVQAKAGLHVVVYGREPFLWHIFKQVSAYGLLEEEISLILSAEDTLTPVYCVHCGHQFVSTQSDFSPCPSCEVHLLIRRHFSQRLGAYMGVCANALAPKGGVA